MKLTGLKLLCFTFGIALGLATAPGSAEINEETEAEIREIVDDCQANKGIGERVINAPFQVLTGGLISLDTGVGRCVDRIVKERAAETEREAEEATRLLMQNCAIDVFRCGSEENQRQCETLWGVSDSCRGHL